MLRLTETVNVLELDFADILGSVTANNNITGYPSNLVEKRYTECIKGLPKHYTFNKIRVNAC